MNVITNLEVLRRTAELTQTALAARVGCSGAYLSLIESGSREPSRALRARLASALGGNPETLLDSAFKSDAPTESGRGADEPTHITNQKVTR